MASQPPDRKSEPATDLNKPTRAGLLDWAVHVLKESDQTPAKHHRLLLDELTALSEGRIDRLLVHMPPGSAKSTFASRLFPAWWFGQHPGSSVIAASHNASLAAYFGGQVRDLISTQETALGYSLLKGNRSALQWRISNGGEYFAAGTRGSIIGRRADLVIVDDPVGSQAQADRAADRDRLWDWYRSDLTTRLKPKGRILIVMTRWHEDDLAGRLGQHVDDGWRILKLPAVAEDGDPLGRVPGEALWPEWEDLQALERKRAMVGDRTWYAAYQQSPRPLEGGLFKVAKLSFHDTSNTPNGQTVRAWDLAATLATGTNNPDWTVGVKMRMEGHDQFMVMDVVRLRGSARDIEQAILTAARSDGTSVHIGLPEDPGQAGKSQVSHLTGLLAGYHVIASRDSGSKFVRAQPLSSQVESGNVSVMRGDWNRAFIDELRDFPYGGKDDQVDAFVRAFTTLIGLGTPARKVVSLHLSR